jgi:hypothetical protein
MDFEFNLEEAYADLERYDCPLERDKHLGPQARRQRASLWQKWKR